MLSVEVPVVLYQAITGQKSSRWSLLFQPVNFAGSRRLATTLNRLGSGALQFFKLGN